jgi:hypothetical protein
MRGRRPGPGCCPGGMLSPAASAAAAACFVKEPEDATSGRGPVRPAPGDKGGAGTPCSYTYKHTKQTKYSAGSLTWLWADIKAHNELPTGHSLQDVHVCWGCHLCAVCGMGRLRQCQSTLLSTWSLFHTALTALLYCTDTTPYILLEHLSHS